MLRVALCEDNPSQAEAVLALLDAYRAEKPGTGMVAYAFQDGAALLDHLSTSGYDLYLLDIFMPGLNGIDLARRIRARDAEAVLIFLTASADFALEAFNVSASQYLLKPVSRDALFVALDKAAAARERDEGRFIMVPVKDRTVRVPFSAIVYVELDGRALRVRLTNGDELFSKTVRVPFAMAVSPLLADACFLHAHKSFVLNMACVRELTPRSFVMEGGDEIPIPRNKYSEAKSRYFDYLSAHGIGMLGDITHAR